MTTRRLDDLGTSTTLESNKSLANMRVSAFVTLYRMLRQGVPLDEARTTMARIWEPNPVWHQFIREALVRGQHEQRQEG